MTTQTLLPNFIGVVSVICAIMGGFFYHQSARGEAAAVNLDLYAGLPNSPVARARFKATRDQLALPRDARLWELEAERRLHLGGHNAIESAADALAVAALKSPARSSIRMRQAYVASRLTTAGADMSRRIEQWYEVSPHDMSMQEWRVALAAREWASLRPQARLLIMQDAEDLCLRFGRARVVEMFGQGGGEPRVAAALRLARTSITCSS